MSDPAFGLVLVSGDSGWSRAVSDALRRRGIERLVLASPHTLADGIDGNAAVVVDGRLHGEAAASVVRAVRATQPAIRVVLLKTEAHESDPCIAELAHWRDTRLPDDQELAQLLERPSVPQREARPPELCRALVGESAAIAEVRLLLERVAPTETPVLITGESGSGKEVIARNIHFRSSRRPGPFVSLNCAVVPRERLEEELFGHETRAGCLDRAAGGTLFLESIAELPRGMQGKLLRLLRERKYERAGSSLPLEYNVRLIAATDFELEAAVATQSFRADLYYQLNVFPIHMPALRERREDIPSLFGELVAREKAESGREIRVTPVAMQWLQQQDWHGNVRELANLVERLSILYPGSEIDGTHLARHFRTSASKGRANTVELPAGQIDLRRFVRDVERRLIERALREANGVTTHAATLLNLRRTTLAHKMKTLRPETQVLAPAAKRGRPN